MLKSEPVVQLRLSSIREVRIGEVHISKTKPQQVTESTPSQIGFVDSERYLAQELCGKGNIFYEDLLTSVGQSWPEKLQLATICCAIRAQASGLSTDAISLAIDVVASSEFGETAAQVLLWALRRMMLSEEVPLKDLEFYKAPIQHVIHYLAKYPADAQTRGRLSQLLSVESCGATGLPIIASLALDLAQVGTRLVPQGEPY